MFGTINPNVGAVIGRPQESVHLSKFGQVVKSAINEIPKRYDKIEIDKYVIMPNHVHMILIITASGGRPMTAPTISWVINQFKGHITKQIGFSVWQKSFNDHIIRNEREYQEI